MSLGGIRVEGWSEGLDEEEAAAEAIGGRSSSSSSCRMEAAAATALLSRSCWQPEEERAQSSGSPLLCPTLQPGGEVCIALLRWSQ